jgi:GT2 family glycosyltransferase
LKSKKVYAIIVTYQGASWIKDCIRSLLLSSYPVKTIIVDNGSSDKTLEIINTFPDIICLPQPKNLGFSRANNVGLSKALKEGADLIFLLNQDAEVQPETIKRLVNCSNKYSNFGIISPVHLNSDGTQFDKNFINWISRDAVEFCSDIYLNRIREIYPVNFVNAAGWLIKRKCLEEVGGFDPLFFMYGEDEDFCHRSLFHGYKIGIVPSATILHKRNEKLHMRNSWSKIMQSSNRYKSIIIVNLKRLDSTISRQILRVVLASMHWVLSNLGGGDISRIIGLLSAYLITVVNFPKVIQHREISSGKGAHWIDSY